MQQLHSVTHPVFYVNEQEIHLAPWLHPYPCVNLFVKWQYPNGDDLPGDFESFVAKEDVRFVHQEIDKNPDVLQSTQEITLAKDSDHPIDMISYYVPCSQKKVGISETEERESFQGLPLTLSFETASWEMTLALKSPVLEPITLQDVFHRRVNVHQLIAPITSGLAQEENLYWYGIYKQQEDAYLVNVLEKKQHLRVPQTLEMTEEDLVHALKSITVTTKT